MPSEMLENDKSLVVGDFIEIPGVPTLGCVWSIDGIWLGKNNDKINVKMQEDPEDEEGKSLKEYVLSLGEFRFI